MQGYKNISYRKCHTCYSEAYSFSLLKILGLQALIQNLFLNQEKAPKALHCLLCSNAMNKMFVKDKYRKVEIEVCFKCSIVLFDSGEIHQVSDRKKFQQHFSESKHSTTLEAPEIELSVESIYEWGHSSFIEYEDPADLKSLYVPWASYALILFVIAFSSWGFKHPQESAKFLFYPSNPLLNHGFNWITACLLHANYTHLFSNLALLIFIVRPVEHVLGSLGTIELFLASGIIGHLFALIFLSGTKVAFVGSSGCIMGLFVFFLLCYPNAKINLWSKLHLYTFQALRLRMSAKAALIFFIAKDLIGYGLLSIPYIGTFFSPVGYISHLGGATAGLLTWLYLGKIQKIPNKKQIPKKAA